jgi:hypothetical protein
MPTLVKVVRNLHRVEFDFGSFDNWCVFLQRHTQQRYPPLDTEYFSFFQNMGTIYGAQKVYSDFVSIYQPTSKNIDASIVSSITSIADTYSNHVEEADIWFTVIYAGMIAEENKANMVLKKRIKRLGMYQLMIQDMNPVDAANFSKGKNWRELDLLMKQYGF